MTPNSPPSPTGARDGSGGRRQRLALLAAVGGLVLGISLHLFTTFLDQNGPRIGPLAFNGNGALVVPFCVLPLVLLVGLILLAIRRAYLPMALFAVTLIVGFAVLGPF